MTKAIAIADAVLELLPADGGAGDDLAELLNSGAREGLILGRETARLAYVALLRDGEAVDIKLLRAGNEAGRDLYRASIRLAEGEFRARRDDALGRVLELIAAERAGKGGI